MVFPPLAALQSIGQHSVFLLHVCSLLTASNLLIKHHVLLQVELHCEQHKPAVRQCWTHAHTYTETQTLPL